jgi:hypothetical protein
MHKWGKSQLNMKTEMDKRILQFLIIYKPTRQMFPEFIHSKVHISSKTVENKAWNLKQRNS